MEDADSRGAPRVATRLALPADIAEVHAIHAEGGYGGGVNADDLVMVATVADSVAGVVRLCPEHGVTVLRGMQVRESARRRGAGRALLAACGQALDQGIAYCLPYSHLVGFYGLAGFRRARPDELPDFLRERLMDYVSRGQDVVAMLRMPRGTRPPADS